MRAWRRCAMLLAAWKRFYIVQPHLPARAIPHYSSGTSSMRMLDNSSVLMKSGFGLTRFFRRALSSHTRALYEPIKVSLLLIEYAPSLPNIMFVGLLNTWCIFTSPSKELSNKFFYCSTNHLTHYLQT